MLPSRTVSTLSAADLSDCCLTRAERERRGAGGHAKSADLSEHGDQLVRETIGEVLVLVSRVVIDERKHGNRRRA
jgi:hypothetical protein